MSSEDKLIIPAFTSPETQTRTEWKYRDEVNESWEKRLDPYNYVGIDGTERKDLGINGAKYPMACIFDGVEHVQDAIDFLQTLRETAEAGSPAYLEHPRLGIIPVVVERVDTAHNPSKDSSETIVNVVFWEQLTLPSQFKESPFIAVKLQLEKLNIAGQNDFASMTKTDKAGSRLSAIKEAKRSLAKIAGALNDVVSKNAQIMSTFDQIQADILNNIDTIITTPATLASQQQQMIGLLLGVPATFKEKMDSWVDLYNRSTGTGLLPDLYYNEPNDITRNRIAQQELASVSALAYNLSNVVLSISSFKTKQEAFDALTSAQQQVDNLGADLDALQGQFDENIFQDQYFSTTETFNNLKELSRIATIAIQEDSAQLRTTILVTLKQDTTLLEIAYKYYNDVSDETLDFIIQANALKLEQVLLLTAGTTIQI